MIFLLIFPVLALIVASAVIELLSMPTSKTRQREVMHLTDYTETYDTGFAG
jgi:hypothetical protein